VNQFQELFDAQKAYFATGITRSYEWRVEQLDRIGRMVSENEAALQAAMGADFKTASHEQVFETPRFGRLNIRRVSCENG